MVLQYFIMFAGLDGVFNTLSYIKLLINKLLKPHEKSTN
jgi:hypothetical protein